MQTDIDPDIDDETRARVEELAERLEAIETETPVIGDDEPVMIPVFKQVRAEDLESKAARLEANVEAATEELREALLDGVDPTGSEYKALARVVDAHRTELRDFRGVEALVERKIQGCELRLTDLDTIEGVLGDLDLDAFRDAAALVKTGERTERELLTDLGTVRRLIGDADPRVLREIGDGGIEGVEDLEDYAEESTLPPREVALVWAFVNTSDVETREDVEEAIAAECDRLEATMDGYAESLEGLMNRRVEVAVQFRMSAKAVRNEMKERDGGERWDQQCFDAMETTGFQRPTFNPYHGVKFRGNEAWVLSYGPGGGS